MLTDTKIKALKGAGKAKKYHDGQGLYLLISASGGKWWRLKYRFEGKEKLLSLGTYPEISLREARDRRDADRKRLLGGLDPGQHRKALKAAHYEKSANCFEVVGREWYAKQQSTWAKNHGPRIIRRLERDIFPWLGQRPVAEITAAELLTCLRRIEERGAFDTAHRALQNCGQVLRYAIATGRAERNVADDLQGALQPAKGTHFAAVTDPKKVAELLRALQSYKGFSVVSCALRLAPLVFVRPGELRCAQWQDIDFDAAEWRFTASKTEVPHIVPLSKQAIAILRELQPITGNCKYVFPSARSDVRPMSDNALLAALRRMGIEKGETTIHGFRAMARTILDEILGFRPELIEHQLAHTVKDANGRAYNRTAHLSQRREMMQRWADFLDELKASDNVVALKRSA